MSTGKKGKTAAQPKPQKGKNIVTAATAKSNAFTSAGDSLGVGIDALFGEAEAQFSMILLEMIEVVDQIRETFEDEENTLEDLAASIKARGVLQPVLLRPTATGYELIAGERRYRASVMAGLELIPAYIRDMTDEEAGDAQLAENIHRKNLTQIEEAKKIQRDLDQLGSVDAVLQKHQKSRPWLSKILSLLSLPEQAKRLVTENVSADVEVINTVKTIEKTDPKKAKALVDDLKQTRGKANARDKAAAVKEQVKPSKKPKPASKGGIVATEKERGHEAPGRVEVFAGAKPLAQVLNDAYFQIAEQGSTPKAVLDAMSAEVKEAVRDSLHSFYDAGKQSKDTGRAVIQGFRNSQFASDGEGAFALVAFLYGADSGAKFDLLNIFGSIKA